MGQFKHPNVVEMHGLVIQREPVSPFVCLLQFLCISVVAAVLMLWSPTGFDGSGFAL
jgi:hypothetical protein